MFAELKHYAKNDFVVLFIFCLICWYIVHGTMVLYPVFNHDGLVEVHGNFGFNVAIERPLLAIWDIVRGEFRVLNVISFWSCLSIAVSVLFLKKIFNINSLSLCILSSLVITTSMSTIVWVATYKAVEFALFGYMFGILSTYYLLQKKNIYVLLASLYLGLCISMYQAEMQVFITLNVICFLLSFLKRDVIPVSYTHYFVRCLIVTLLGLFFYVSIAYISHIIFNIPSHKGYNSPMHLLDLSFSKIISQVLNAYSYFFTKMKEYIHYANFVLKYVTLTILVLSVVMYYIFCNLINVNYKKIIFSLLLWIVFPLCVVCIWIASFGVTGDHSLLSFTLVLCLPIFIYNPIKTLILKNNFYLNKITQLLYKSCVILIVVQIYYNFVYANGLYQRQHANYIATASIYSSIINDLHNYEGFVPTKTKVLLIGDPETLDINNCSYGNTSIKNKASYNYMISGIWNKCKSTSYYQTIHSFIRNILGYKINLGSQADNKKISMTKEFKNMPTYPYNGYIKFIDGMLVVKIGKN